MISQVLGSIGGIEKFPIISLFLFFSFFIGMLVVVLRMNKKYADKMKNLPLEDERAEANTGYQDGI
jgi:cytochrome c oxidase cbb3-type subunit 3